MSLPLRGAWIETVPRTGGLYALSSRSPCGGRGLKLVGPVARVLYLMSLPLRGAWIETPQVRNSAATSRRSPCGGRGLKLLL